MIDGEGYMHVSFDHHGHPLNYCRSIAPGSLELGDKMPMTGVDEGNVTYPEFYPYPEEIYCLFTAPVLRVVEIW